MGCYLPSLGGAGGGHNPPYLAVLIVIEQFRAAVHALQVLLKLVEIDLIGREHIDMVPGHTAQHADMRMVEKYLRPLFHNRSRVFIAFQYYQRRIGQLHRLSKTRYLSAYQVVEFNTLVL